MNWLQYLILVNIYLVLFYVFYALLLSRETFFQLNRIYLVGAALLSFFIPMVQSDWVKDLFITQKVQYTIYSSPIILYQFKPIRDAHLTIGQVFTAVYVTGIVFLLARFAWQLIVLNKMMSKQLSAAAFSFFNNVKLGDDTENRDIIAEHENAHARQWHSADVLIMEAVMIVNWFNPVVYLYRFAVKHIHEFIADRQALKSGASKADYALLLLSQTFDAPAHQLINPFYNKSLLKLRIMMLQKTKSERKALIKYFLSAPLFILMLILSSATVNNSKTIFLIDKNVQKVFLKPAKLIGSDIISNNLASSTMASSSTNTVTTQDTTQKPTGPVFTSVEQVPEFVGGLKAFGIF